MTSRKRGGQPGNLNALKHGFYSRQFRDLEAGDLEDLLADGLVDEISMLRVITRRVLEMAEGVESLDKMIEILGVLGLASTRLASMLKTQKILSGGGDETTEAISEALSEVIAELGIK